MNILFFILFFISFICLIIGLINPSIFVRFLKERATRKSTAIIFGVSALAFFILFAMMIEPTTQTRQAKKENVQKTEKATEEKPSWYGKTYKITTIDKQEGEEDYDVDSVRAWPSYDDKSSVLFELTNNESVSLIGYNSEYDYCQVKKDKQDGWIACVWIQNLPNKMADYWDDWEKEKEEVSEPEPETEEVEKNKQPIKQSTETEEQTAEQSTETTKTKVEQSTQPKEEAEPEPEPQTDRDKMIEIFKEEASAKWGDDYEMVKHTIKKQTEAYDWVIKNAKYSNILKRAKQKWNNDYEMVKHEYKKQVEAYEWINQQTAHPEIMTRAKQKWGDDYEMVKYEYEKQVKAYEAL